MSESLSSSMSKREQIEKYYKDEKFDTVKSLIKLGVDPSWEFSSGLTFLQRFTFDNKYELVKTLVNYFMDEDRINRQTDGSKEQRRKYISSTIDRTGSVDVMLSYESKTPLYIAIFFGYDEIVKVLIDAEANLEFDIGNKLEIDEYENENAITLAIRKKHIKVFNILVDFYKNNGYDINYDDLIFHAIKYKSNDVLKRILELGGNPNAENIDGDIAILIAGNENLEGLKILLETDFVFVEDLSKLGTQVKETVLHKTVSLNNKELTKDLIKRGASLNIYNYMFEFPTDIALRGGKLNAIEGLIEGIIEGIILSDRGKNPFRFNRGQEHLKELSYSSKYENVIKKYKDEFAKVLNRLSYNLILYTVDYLFPIRQSIKQVEHDIDTEPEIEQYYYDTDF